MGKVRRSTLVCLTLLLTWVAGCKVSCTTANISSLKLGKDKEVSQETNNFSPTDTIYAVADISNNPSTVKVKGSMAFVDVEGQSGPITGMEKTLDVPGSRSVTFTFTHERPFPKGRYKVEVLMLNEGGEQKDQKAVEFTIS